MEKTVVITGATSFIGKALMERLCQRDYRIFAVVRPGAQTRMGEFDRRRIQAVECDMGNYVSLSNKIEQCDIFISLAWDGTRGRARDDAVRQKNNYLYSLQALYAAAAMCCKIFISAGSQAEYGNLNGKITEDALCRPTTEYGKWKLAFYEEARKYCGEHGIALKEPRFFSLYGENDAETTMVIDIAKKMLKNEPCELTLGIQNWDYLYISDAIEGLIRLMEIKCDDGVYNFGSGDVRQLKEYVAEMYTLTHSASELRFGAIPYADTGMVSIWPDITKLRAIGWRAEVPFSLGMQRIIDRYRRRGSR